MTGEGCVAAGLPASYPRRDGGEVGWEECQAVGLSAWEEGEAGIACRSAVHGLAAEDEELAWFDRGEKLEVRSRRAFEDWFWPG